METPKFISDCIKYRHNMTLYTILTKILYENIDLELYNEINNYIITNLNYSITREIIEETNYNITMNSILYYWFEIPIIEILVKEWNTKNNYKIKIKY